MGVPRTPHPSRPNPFDLVTRVYFGICANILRKNDGQLDAPGDAGACLRKTSPVAREYSGADLVVDMYPNLYRTGEHWRTGMRDKQLVLITPEIWRAIENRAASEQMRTEAWLAKQAAGEMTSDRECENEKLIDLAVRHFRDQELTPHERQAVAAALFRALEKGEAAAVGPVGRRQFRYQVRRRAKRLIIRVGESALELRLAPAARLATLLLGAQTLETVNDIAA